MNKLFKILSLTLILFFVFNYESDSTIINVKISKENRILIYFDSEIPSYSDSISVDKKKITLIIPNNSFPDSISHIKGKHNFKDVYLLRNGDNSRIEILCTEESGYTSVILPFSNAIMFETFNWNNLSAAEEKYRESLLAYDYGNATLVKENLKYAAGQGNQNASALLSIFSLKENDLERATNHALLAIKNKSDIPEVYAVAANIFNAYNYVDKEDFFKKLFFQKTGLNKIKYFEIENVPDSLGEFISSFIQDSSLFKTQTYVEDLLKQQDSNKKDEIDKQFANLFADTNSTEAKKENYDANEPSEFTSDMFTKILYVMLGLIILLSAFIIFSYFKWRSIQKKKQMDTTGKQFNNEMKQAESSVSKKYPSKSLNRYKEENEKKEKKAEPKKEKKESTKVSTDKEKDNERIYELLSKISDQKKENKLEDEIEDTKSEKKTKLPENIEIAMKLKQRENKEKSSENEANSLLKSVADKLGKEKEKKEKIPGQMSSEKQAITKLEKKFSVKKRKNK